MTQQELDRNLEALATQLCRRGFLHNGRTRWGRPFPYAAACGRQPQQRMDARPLQKRFVACAYATPSPGPDLCASWVEQAFSRLGLGIVLGDAAQLYRSYCHYDDLGELLVGMIVAVPRHPYSLQGTIHGHVGIYVGDGMVMDAADGRVRHVPLVLWLNTYGLMDEPRWGWLGSMGLT